MTFEDVRPSDFILENRGLLLSDEVEEVPSKTHKR